MGKIVITGDWGWLLFLRSALTLPSITVTAHSGTGHWGTGCCLTKSCTRCYCIACPRVRTESARGCVYGNWLMRGSPTSSSSLLLLSTQHYYHRICFSLTIFTRSFHLSLIHTIRSRSSSYSHNISYPRQAYVIFASISCNWMIACYDVMLAR